MNKKCDAKALITGKDIYKEIIGKAYFYNTNNGVLVVMEEYLEFIFMREIAAQEMKQIFMQIRRRIIILIGAIILIM